MVLGIFLAKRATTRNEIFDNSLVASVDSVQERSVANNVDIVETSPAREEEEHSRQVSTPTCVMDGIALALGVFVAIRQLRSLIQKEFSNLKISALASKEKGCATIKTVHIEQCLASLGEKGLHSRKLATSDTSQKLHASITTRSKRRRRHS